VSVIVISAMFSWKEDAGSTDVGAAHRALAEFARDIPGVRMCRYGLDEESRTSVVYAVYDSPEALRDLYEALVARGGGTMAAELAVTELIPERTFIQGSQASLDAVAEVIDGWGLQRFHTDSQGSAHVAL